MLFLSKTFVSLCLMHENIGVIIGLDNQVQQPYRNMINNTYTYLFDPAPLKFSTISGENDFSANSGLGMYQVSSEDKLDGGPCQYFDIWYPGSCQHELQMKIPFNPLLATSYVGIANFLENAQQ